MTQYFMRAKRLLAVRDSRVRHIGFTCEKSAAPAGRGCMKTQLKLTIFSERLITVVKSSTVIS